MSSKFYNRFREKTTDTYLDIADDDLQKAVIDGSIISRADKCTLAARCELLEEFKRLCKFIDIDYYAIGDTLRSAAVQGYYGDMHSNCNNIDNASDTPRGVSVAIKRENLNDFLLLLGQELDPWFNYSCIYSGDKCEDMRICIRTDSYMCDEKEFAERFHGCSKEVYLYISVIDVISSDEDREATRKMLIENLIATAESMPDTPPYSDEVLGIVTEWERLAAVKVNTEVNLRREFLRAADDVAAGKQGKESGKVRITADLQRGIDSVYDKDAFETVTELSYGWTTINVPIGYKGILWKGK